MYAGHGRSSVTTYMSSDNSDHIRPSGVRLSQNGEIQKVKTVTMRDYTFTASSAVPGIGRAQFNGHDSWWKDKNDDDSIESPTF